MGLLGGLFESCFSRCLAYNKTSTDSKLEGWRTHLICKGNSASCSCVSICMFLLGVTSVDIYIGHSFEPSVYKRPMLGVIIYYALGGCQGLLYDPGTHFK